MYVKHKYIVNIESSMKLYTKSHYFNDKQIISSFSKPLCINFDRRKFGTETVSDRSAETFQQLKNRSARSSHFTLICIDRVIPYHSELISSSTI